MLPLGVRNRLLQIKALQLLPDFDIGVWNENLLGAVVNLGNSARTLPIRLKLLKIGALVRTSVRLQARHAFDLSASGRNTTLPLPR